MATTKTVPFDPAEHLTDAEDHAELLNDALASGNPGYIANALGTIARAHGMTKVAREAGVTREALYKALTRTGDPKLGTFVNVIAALNLRLTAQPEGRRSKTGAATRSSKPARSATASRRKWAGRAGKTRDVRTAG